MKSICFICLLLPALLAKSQSIELRAGHSLIPGDYVALRYQHPTNYSFEFSISVFLDKSRTHGLNYSASGAEILIEFPFSLFKIGAGPTIQYESEPWVYQYRSFSQKLNYGLATEGSAELFLTDAFALTAFINQKYLFNKGLGQFHFVFGVGLKYSFGN